MVAEETPVSCKEFIHVLPVNDLRPHVEEGATQCWCKPDTAEYETCYLVVHHSADGRELIEQHGLQ